MPAFGLEIVNTPESTFSAVSSSSYACLNHQRWDRPVCKSLTIIRKLWVIERWALAKLLLQKSCNWYADILQIAAAGGVFGLEFSRAAAETAAAHVALAGALSSPTPGIAATR
jgi:hypothetical protein